MKTSINRTETTDLNTGNKITINKQYPNDQPIERKWDEDEKVEVPSIIALTSEKGPDTILEIDGKIVVGDSENNKTKIFPSIIAFERYNTPIAYANVVGKIAIKDNKE